MICIEQGLKRTGYASNDRFREYLFSLLAYSLYETYGLPLEFTV